MNISDAPPAQAMRKNDGINENSAYSQRFKSTAGKIRHTDFTSGAINESLIFVLRFMSIMSRIDESVRFTPMAIDSVYTVKCPRLKNRMANSAALPIR